MRDTAFCLVLSISFTSAVSYAYTPEVSRSFPELPRLNQKVPELSQEAYHTHWCIQTFEAENTKMYSITGRSGLGAKSDEEYLYWIALSDRNKATDQQRRIIRDQVEDMYGFSLEGKGPYVFSSNHIAAACTLRYYHVSLEELRLKGSVPGLSQKAYHTHWCLQAHDAFNAQTYLTTGDFYTEPSFMESYEYWRNKAKGYIATDKQVLDVRHQLNELYNYGQGRVPYFFRSAHYELHCNHRGNLELYNTAKD